MPVITNTTEKEVKAGRPKSSVKQANILRAATKLFLELGYTHTSMNLVANSAEVSKQTVYSHFKNKDALFTAVVEFKCEEYQLDKAHLEGAKLALKDIMLQIGGQFMQLMADPEVIAMYRVLIGEVNSNPHVAVLFYEAGPQYAINALGAFIHKHYQQLPAEETRYWSTVFFNMLKGECHMRGLLGLPFKISKENQSAEVAKVTGHVIFMLENSIADSCSG